MSEKSKLCFINWIILSQLYQRRANPEFALNRMNIVLENEIFTLITNMVSIRFFKNKNSIALFIDKDINCISPTNAVRQLDQLKSALQMQSDNSIDWHLKKKHEALHKQVSIYMYKYFFDIFSDSFIFYSSCELGGPVLFHIVYTCYYYIYYTGSNIR